VTSVPGAASTGHHILVALGFCASLFLLYQQSFSFDYAYFDDADYVLKNPVVMEGLSWQGIYWAMTSLQLSNWHPLTWMSHMLDVSLFGSAPGPAHIHNVVLHGINSILVYALLLRWAGAFVPAVLLSLIFLVHPLHVESVAWIAERKDLLCALFYLLSLLLYDKFRRTSQCRWYIATMVCALLALMAKAMAVSLPVVMVLLDLTLYRTENDRRLPSLRAIIISILGKLPLIFMVAAACAVAVIAQDGNQALAYLSAHSFTDRLETAASAYLIYIKQWLLPLNLVAFYPLSTQGTLAAWLLPSLAVFLLCATAMAFWKQIPQVTLGWAWYVVTLLPVVGLVQVGAQAHADRYMYLPSIGLLLIAGTLFPARKNARYQSAITLAALFTVFLGALCYLQVSTWKNQYTVFSRVLELEGPNHKAHIHLTGFYLRYGELDKAEKHATASISMAPKLGDGYQAMGNIALAQGRFQEAESYFRKALEAGPELGAVFNNLGIALAQQDKQTEATQAFTKAVELSPSLSSARENLQTQRQKAGAQR